MSLKHSCRPRIALFAGVSTSWGCPGQLGVSSHARHPRPAPANGERARLDGNLSDSRGRSYALRSESPDGMIHLTLETFIAASVDRCFDLSPSIDLHMASTDWTGERAIAGVTSGLIGFGQQVTWEERHFGFKLHHTSRITEYDRPHHFQDCMVRGRFKSFC